ncbi:MAG: pentapeptide repeat-containing protein [Gammaproteobacteria bacterium]
MFQPIFLLCQYNHQDCKKHQAQRFRRAGKDKATNFIELLSNGGDTSLTDGQPNDFYSGIAVYNQSFDFTENSQDSDHLKFLDLSYLDVSETRFTETIFFGTNFNFCNFRSCKFEKCTFVQTEFFAVRFRNCTFSNCKFISSSFINTDFMKTSILNSFVAPGNPFLDCRFSRDSVFPRKLPSTWSNEDVELDTLEEYEIYDAIGDSYSAAGVYNIANDYYYLSKEAFRKYNLDDHLKKIKYWLLKIFLGYGFKPFRVLGLMFTIPTVFSPFMSYLYSVRFIDTFESSIASVFLLDNTGMHNTDFLWMKFYFGVLIVFGLLSYALLGTSLAKHWFDKKL